MVRPIIKRTPGTGDDENGEGGDSSTGQKARQGKKTVVSERWAVSGGQWAVKRGFAAAQCGKALPFRRSTLNEFEATPRMAA
jgi:hypothetical protein